MGIPLGRLAPYPATRQRPSGNASPRREHAGAIELLVLHHTAGTDEGAEAWMENPASQVSAHLHVRRDGTTTRHVADELAAWHAGVCTWRGLSSRQVRDRSIGVEIGNRGDGTEPYTDAQYATTADIVAHYLAQGLPRDCVTDHATIAPGRKVDPYLWDWDRMWREVARVQALAAIPPPPAPVPEPEIPARVYYDYWTDTVEVDPPPVGDLAPPVRPTPEPHPLTPLRVPEPPPLSGWWGAYQWAQTAARQLAAEAAPIAVAYGRARALELLDAALARLREIAAPHVPALLLAVLWPRVEREARRLVETVG